MAKLGKGSLPPDDFDDITPSEDLIPTKDLRVEGFRIGAVTLIRMREEGREQAFTECKRKCRELYLSWRRGMKLGMVVGALLVTCGALVLLLRW